LTTAQQRKNNTSSQTAPLDVGEAATRYNSNSKDKQKYKTRFSHLRGLHSARLGVRSAVLDMKFADAMLVVEVSASELVAAASYINAKLNAGEQAKEVIEKRWTAIQQASCKQLVAVPSHLARFVLKKDRTGLECLRGYAGVVHVDWDKREDNIRGCPQLCIWATNEDGLKQAVAWVNRQMRMGDALLLEKVDAVKPVHY
jgi:hypothetical protein